MIYFAPTSTSWSIFAVQMDRPSEPRSRRGSISRTDIDPCFGFHFIFGSRTSAGSIAQGYQRCPATTAEMAGPVSKAMGSQDRDAAAAGRCAHSCSETEGGQFFWKQNVLMAKILIQCEGPFLGPQIRRGFCIEIIGRT